MKIIKAEYEGKYYLLGNEITAIFDSFKTEVVADLLSVDLYRDGFYVLSINFTHASEFCRQWRILNNSL